jgi:putative transposase
LYGQLRKYLGTLLQDLARLQDCEILEGHLQPDHIHILILIPPKLSVSKVIGYFKGKSAIAIARTYLGRRKNYRGLRFGPEVYYVNTVGADEETVRAYIQKQSEEDKRLDQLNLF